MVFPLAPVLAHKCAFLQDVAFHRRQQLLLGRSAFKSRGVSKAYTLKK
jgi:hypothetical protein